MNSEPTRHTQQPLLAIAMIVRNEASNLAACLESCQDLADEIVIVDSGSEDNTAEIAHRFPKVRFFEHNAWRGFGLQRRTAQEHIQAKWVFWIDADERVTPALAASIRQVIHEYSTNDSDTNQTSPSGPRLFSVNRLSWVFGRFIRHSGWHPDWVVRLYQTDATQYSDDTVHEHVMKPANATIIKLDGNLLHYTYRDLQHYLVKSAQYASLWAQQRASRGKKASLGQGVTHALGCFLKMYVLKAGFLDGRQGLLLALLSSHSTFAKYADLWIRQQPDSEKPGSAKPGKPH